MAWIKRGRYRYYSRSVREGKKVRQVRFGKGPLAQLAANLDELGGYDRQERARVWRDEQARCESADGLLEGLCNATDMVTEAALTEAGFHRHDRGGWRKKRRVVTDTNIRPAAEPMTQEDLQGVFEAARHGDRSVLPVLRQLLDANPQFWQNLGDLAAHAERAMIGLAAGDDLALGEALLRKVAALKIELAGPTPSPMEKLLVDRVAVSWLQVHHADSLISQSRDRGLSLAQLDHFEKRQERAQRGYLAAIKALATVRKLLPAGPRPPAAAGQECLVEALRRDAKGARDGGSGERVDQPPETGKKVTAKGRKQGASRVGRKRPRESVIPGSRRDRLRGMVASEN